MWTDPTPEIESAKGKQLGVTGGCQSTCVCPHETVRTIKQDEMGPHQTTLHCIALKCIELHEYSTVSQCTASNPIKTAL